MFFSGTLHTSSKSPLHVSCDIKIPVSPSKPRKNFNKTKSILSNSRVIVLLTLLSFHHCCLKRFGHWHKEQQVSHYLHISLCKVHARGGIACTRSPWNMYRYEYSMLSVLASTRKAPSSILLPSSLLRFSCTRVVVRGRLLLQAHHSRMPTWHPFERSAIWIELLGKWAIGLSPFLQREQTLRHSRFPPIACIPLQQVVPCTALSCFEHSSFSWIPTSHLWADFLPVILSTLIYCWDENHFNLLIHDSLPHLVSHRLL